MNEVGVEYQVDFQRKEELLKSDYFWKRIWKADQVREEIVSHFADEFRFPMYKY